MNASWYDVLDVDPAATPDEIRTAWRSAVADLDPTDRRFRVFNQAAEVLLDPARRAAYDEELAAEAEVSDEPLTVEPVIATAPVPEPTAVERVETPGTRPARRLPVVPGWAVVTLAGLVAASLVIVGVLMSKPSDASVQDDTQAAQSAAERAIVPLLSYDAHHLDQSEAAAEPYMTSSEKQEYDKLFAVIRQNAPRTGTVVQAKYLASGIVRTGTDQVDVLVFVNQVTRNKQHPKVPVVYKNQVTVTMAKVGGQWLVDGLKTNSGHG
ncbi:MAG TPA: DnaJ domain-containing protein [Nocardioides sp.]|uniref:J domain-containing protein n=1 Tax=Nocardioides sp. TaxID=35761 RepID=UPI002F3ED1C4